MVNTIVLDVDKDLAEFVHRQPGAVDPSAFVNQLLHQEMQREGFTMSASQSKGQASRQKDTQALEDHIDESIPAAG
jgi:hypothetical protein